MPTTPAPHFHCVVWIDHNEAHVLRFSMGEGVAVKATIRPAHAVQHLHHKSGEIGSGNAAENHAYLSAVATALADAGAILVTGPADEKVELVKHLRAHNPKIADRVVGTEAADHPSDGELIAHARKYFQSADRMTPQRA